MAMKPETAREILSRCGVPRPRPDYHALPSTIVESLSEARTESAYRAPRNRNGSATRYFYAFLCTRANKES